MSDQARRAGERRFRASGDPRDEARWLTEEVRAGRLERERLVLAAYLGHPPALGALGLEAAEDVDASHEMLLRWLGALDRGGRRALVAAAVNVLRARFVDVPSPRARLAEVLGLLEAYRDAPSDETGAAVIAIEPRLGALREALVRDRSFEVAGFVRRLQDAARAVGACMGLTLAEDPFGACLHDVRGAGARARELIEWALSPGGREGEAS